MTGPMHTSDVLIAGVPWPRHKLFAVIAGFVTLVLVGILTTSAAPSVLAGAAVAIVVGLVLKALANRPHRSRRSRQLPRPR
jgi:Flp pilus assembly protein TadB